MATPVQKIDFYESLLYICVRENIIVSITAHNASVTVFIFLTTAKFLWNLEEKKV